MGGQERGYDPGKKIKGRKRRQHHRQQAGGPDPQRHPRERAERRQEGKSGE